jgi:quinol monooxygenase YgiN
MTIGVIATLKVADGKGGDLEAAFRDLIAEVKAKEPGNKMYSLFRSQSDANTYVVMEVYDDKAAVEAHNKSDHFRAAMPKIGSILAGAPDIKFFDAV